MPEIRQYNLREILEICFNFIAIGIALFGIGAVVVWIVTEFGK